MSETPETYCEGQCTDYVSDALPWIPPWLGNAIDWLADAKRDGFPTSDKPAVGSVVVYGAAYDQYGHVAIVTAVHGDGTFTVSEANFKYPTGSDGIAHSDNRISTMYGVEGFILNKNTPVPAPKPTPPPAPKPVPPAPKPPAKPTENQSVPTWFSFPPGKTATVTAQTSQRHGWNSNYGDGPLAPYGDALSHGAVVTLDASIVHNGMTYYHVNGGEEGWLVSSDLQLH